MPRFAPSLFGLHPGPDALKPCEPFSLHREIDGPDRERRLFDERDSHDKNGHDDDEGDDHCADRRGRGLAPSSFQASERGMEESGENSGPGERSQERPEQQVQEIREQQHRAVEQQGRDPLPRAAGHRAFTR